MISWKLKNGFLEYDEDTHTYFVDGVVVPSITQLLKIKYPKKYEGINSDILKKAANRGTLVHNLIQLYEELGLDNCDVEQGDQLKHYIQLKKCEQFEVLGCEVPIILRYKNLVAAGRLDLVLKEEGREGIGLGDIKTTAYFDTGYLIDQLTLYKIGYQQTYDEYIGFLRGIYLREDKKRYIRIPIMEDEIYNFLDSILNKGEK